MEQLAAQEENHRNLLQSNYFDVSIILSIRSSRLRVGVIARCGGEIR